jgi:hypothetical protein
MNLFGLEKQLNTLYSLYLVQSHLQIRANY